MRTSDGGVGDATVASRVRRRLLDSALAVHVAVPLRRALLDLGAVRRWERAGRPAPPPHAVKVAILREHAAGRDTFVETGTYLGDTVAAMRPLFRRLVTIELDRDLHARATRRFARHRNVDAMQGDSGVALSRVLAGLTAPALFWLDAHYSGGMTARGDGPTPLLAELAAILQHPVRGHAILVDDARDLGTPGYPTRAEIEQLVAAWWPAARVDVRDDVLRILPA